MFTKTFTLVVLYAAIFTAVAFSQQSAQMPNPQPTNNVATSNTNFRVPLPCVAGESMLVFATNTGDVYLACQTTSGRFSWTRLAIFPSDSFPLDVEYANGSMWVLGSGGLLHKLAPNQNGDFTTNVVSWNMFNGERLYFSSDSLVVASSNGRQQAYKVNPDNTFSFGQASESLPPNCGDLVTTTSKDDFCADASNGIIWRRPYRFPGIKSVTWEELYRFKSSIRMTAERNALYVAAAPEYEYQENPPVPVGAGLCSFPMQGKVVTPGRLVKIDLSNDGGLGNITELVTGIKSGYDTRIMASRGIVYWTEIVSDGNRYFGHRLQMYDLNSSKASAVTLISPDMLGNPDYPVMIGGLKIIR